MKTVATPITADRPDQRVLNTFGLLSTLSLSVVGLTAGIILTGWQGADFDLILPDGWWLMQASTALVVLLLSLGLQLPHQRRYHMLLGRQSCGGAAIVISALSQMDPLTEQSGLCSLLVTESLLTLTHPMAIQTAFCFILLGAALLIEPSRRDAAGLLLDAVIMVLVILTLVFISAYLFGAELLIGLFDSVTMSLQTLACITLLTFVLVGQRSTYGFLSVLVGSGIGSQLARRLLPLAVIAAFLIILVGERLIKCGILSLPYSAAVTSAFMAVLLISVVILLARRINHLERGLRDMSLTDELTGLHNLRGFSQLGEQSLQEAKRHGHPAMLLFFDVDGLKRVNDTLGHEVGSQLLKEFAQLLKETFRGSDIVGRVGGDEFAVITAGRHHDTSAALQRLTDATEAVNAGSGRSYLLSYSVGRETVEPQQDLTLPQLMTRADAAMYRHKRQKRLARAAPSGGSCEPDPEEKLAAAAAEGVSSQ